MAMFDHFEPVPALQCPKCGAELHGWQGKPEGGNQFLWRQGEVAPVSHVVDEKWKWTRDRLAAVRLTKPEFEIYVSCKCSQWVLANCKCLNSVWVETKLQNSKRDDA